MQTQTAGKSSPSPSRESREVTINTCAEALHDLCEGRVEDKGSLPFHPQIHVAKPGISGRLSGPPGILLHGRQALLEGTRWEVLALE